VAEFHETRGWCDPPEWVQELRREHPDEPADPTEAEWLGCRDRPMWMVGPLVRPRSAAKGAEEPRPDRSPSCREWRDRKARLLICAACRLVWHLLPGGHGRPFREFIETLESVADERATEHDLQREYDRLSRTVLPNSSWSDVPLARAERAAQEINRTLTAPLVEAVWWAMQAVNWIGWQETEVCQDRSGLLWLDYIVAAAWSEAAEPGDPIDEPNAGSVPMSAAISHLIRDVSGNPFRPVEFGPEWRTDTAVLLARQMYASRDFSAMPILADALQDAGCDNETILSHCRDVNRVHVRGCWVVDLVLGKL
jgi:hypothetical protein